MRVETPARQSFPHELALFKVANVGISCITANATLASTQDAPAQKLYDEFASRSPGNARF